MMPLVVALAIVLVLAYSLRCYVRALQIMTQERDVLHQLATGILRDDRHRTRTSHGDKHFRQATVEAVERALGYDRVLNEQSG